MAEENALKNVFNEMPSLEDIQTDLRKLIDYNKKQKDGTLNPNDFEENKPKLFNLSRQLKLPEKKYNSSPIKINITVDKNFDKLFMTVIAKLNAAAPEYKGTQEEDVEKFIRSSYGYSDFYRMIERCIAGFETDDIEDITQLFEKAGVEDMDEFAEQIYVTKEFKNFLKVYDEELTIKDIAEIIDKMIMSANYGLKYFESTLISKNSPDGFDYSRIAEEIIDILMNDTLK